MRCAGRRHGTGNVRRRRPSNVPTATVADSCWMKSLGRSSSAGLAFIGAWPIESGHRNIQKAKIDGKLRAMMNEVVEDHAPDTRDARHSKNRRATREQGPA